MKFAKGTVVSPEKTQAEIRVILKRYGADGFLLAEQGGHAVIMFKKDNRSVRFDVKMPDRTDPAFTRYGSHNQYQRTDTAAQAQWEQAIRQRWRRALALGIKAKLEFIESGTTTFEEEFFAHIVTKGGSTVYEVIVPQLADQARTAPPHAA